MSEGHFTSSGHFIVLRGVKDGKISLSMKALEEVQEEPVEKVEIPKSENIGTSLGDLFEDLKF